MHKGRRVRGAVGGVVEILMPPINALNVTLIAISRSPVELCVDQHCLPIAYVSANAAGDVSREYKRAAGIRRCDHVPLAYYNELSPMMKYRGNEWQWLVNELSLFQRPTVAQRELSNSQRIKARYAPIDRRRWFVLSRMIYPLGGFFLNPFAFRHSSFNW